MRPVRPVPDIFVQSIFNAAAVLAARGFEPIWKDWDQALAQA